MTWLAQRERRASWLISDCHLCKLSSFLHTAAIRWQRLSLLLVV